LSARAPAVCETGEVTALNHDGEGVVHQGKTAFVPGALPGETIRFTRRKRHRQYDEAQLHEVVTASPLRVVSPCPHFATCGGCALQHLSPESQLHIKQQQLQENLLRIGKVTTEEWFDPITGPIWRYRRRARLGARYVFKLERSLVGFRERQGSFIAALDGCEVLAAPLNRLLTPLSQLLTALSIRERVPQIEVAIADEVVALVLRVLSPPSATDLALLLAFEATHAVRLYLQSAGLDSVRPLREPAPVLEYALPEFDLKLQFLPTDFVQINAAVNRRLVQRAAELLQLTPESRVLDLFCGLGNFTLAMARHAGEVVGVEGEAGLVARARANAIRNGIGNARFQVADLAQEPAAGASWLAGGYTHVVLDPPRAGARELLPAIARLRPKRVVYVSCHPASFARDLGLLVNEHSFRLLGMGVADMFPHTAHVEAIAVLRPE